MSAQLPMQSNLFPRYEDIAVNAKDNDEYYTPPEYADAVREVFRGDIDVDPASCLKANEYIQALHYYTQHDNGLKQPWYGAVWNNPPYSKVNGASQSGLWFQKLCEEYWMGRVEQGIFLCNVSTGSDWFQPILERAVICFAEDRIAFIDCHGTPQKQPRYDNCFAYIGPYEQRFKAVFSRFGSILRLA